MLYGKRAALHLKKQRRLLRKQHADLLADLAKSSGQEQPAELSERIKGIRLALRQAQIDAIQICRILSERMYVLNLGGIVDALTANRRLSVVCNDVAKTLSELDEKETGK